MDFKSILILLASIIGFSLLGIFIVSMYTETICATIMKHKSNPIYKMSYVELTAQLYYDTESCISIVAEYSNVIPGNKKDEIELEKDVITKMQELYIGMIPTINKLYGKDFFVNQVSNTYRVIRTKGRVAEIIRLIKK